MAIFSEVSKPCRYVPVVAGIEVGHGEAAAARFSKAPTATAMAGMPRNSSIHRRKPGAAPGS